MRGKNAISGNYKKTDEWWIGWLVDLPGVNAQEKTREKLIESLAVGAMEMLALEVPFEADAIMTTVNIPDPSWIAGFNTKAS